MATVKIELDLDWIHEDSSIDEVIKERVITTLQDRLIENAEDEITRKLNAVIEGIASKVTDSYLEETLKTKIENLHIPHKKSSWGSEVELIPISEYVGMRYERYLNEKKFNEKGEVPRYRDDAKISISEYFIKNYLEKELSSKVSEMIQKARKDAEETIVKALENNLKEQLSVDIINRLNIPEMLKSLQNKADLLGGTSE